MKNRGRITAVVLIIFLLLLWEYFPREGNLKVFLPKFTIVISSFFQNLISYNFLVHIYFTVIRTLSGFLFACIIMIPLGILMGRIKFIYQLFEPLIEFFGPMPSAAIIPIAILFLGIDNEMKLFVIFFGCSWPILINTIEGVKSIEPLYLKTSKVFHFNKTKLFLHIIIPASAPLIIAGIRISIAIALILSITVEMIVGGNGIGYFILDAERSFNFPDMYAGVLTIGILGLFINFIIIKIEQYTIPWYKKSKSLSEL